MQNYKKLSKKQKQFVDLLVSNPAISDIKLEIESDGACKIQYRLTECLGQVNLVSRKGNVELAYGVRVIDGSIASGEDFIDPLDTPAG